MGQPQRPDDDNSGTMGKTVGSGRYELGRLLGRGGMAEVSMAHDVRLGRTVAVKTLRADLAQDAVARSRFGREAQNAASLNHPAIVSVYDTGEDRIGGELVPFIVMECVEGRTVRELLTEGNPIPQEQALRITEGVLEALEYSHRNGIIHRDIKPANVIITDSGAVKVMDFGIARAMHSAATTMTQTGMVMGTPQYLSPEQALGRTVDARSDLYSSGCLLYELLALRPPFNGDTPLSVVYQHVQDDPRPPSAHDARVPAHLDAIALKALAKSPDDRYQTAEEMRLDIRRALAGQTVRVTPPPVRGSNAPTEQLGQWSAGAPTARLGAPVGDDMRATTAVPQPPRGVASDGRTGAFPAVEEHERRQRGPGFFVVVGVVVVALIAGVTALVLTLGKGDKPDGTENTDRGTPTATAPQTPTPTGGAQQLPQGEDTEPTQPTRNPTGRTTPPSQQATTQAPTATATTKPTQTTTAPTNTATSKSSPPPQPTTKEPTPTSTASSGN
ncbi:protein kinase domain-containing protein [Uniformispora flossi]|uniref:protein kinase domain-containing protein n=1 Tax=Uniformispora flossi TaxID=3390723 RepID=UPI003C2F0767